MLMKNTIFLLILLFFVSCNSKENKIKAIINNSYYGLGMTKLNEIEKLQEDIFSLPVHYTIVQKHEEIEEGDEYEIVRYIYKTGKGVHRMFYLVDYTKERVVKKSSDYEDFFAPISKDILGESALNMRGDNTMELMRY